MPEGPPLATPLHAPGLHGAIPGSPGKQPWWWFRLALMVDCDLQRGQIHAQQFGDSLPPIDVPVLVQDLHRGMWGHADTVGVGEGLGWHREFWGHSELCVINWGYIFLGRRARVFFVSSGEGPIVIKAS